MRVLKLSCLLGLKQLYFCKRRDKNNSFYYLKKCLTQKICFGWLGLPVSRTFPDNKRKAGRRPACPDIEGISGYFSCCKASIVLAGN